MSVTLTVNFGTATQDEVQAAIAMLQDYDRRALRSQVQAGNFQDEVQDVAAVPSQVQSSTLLGDANAREAAGPAAEAASLMTQGAESLATKARRGRPRKEVAAEQVDPQPAPTATAQPAIEPTPKAEDSAPAAEGSFTPATWTAALTEYRALLIEGGVAESVADTSIITWGSYSAENMAKLQDAIALTRKKLAEKKPAAVEPPAEPTPTVDQLREALQAMVARDGMAKALEVLNGTFGCQRVSEVAQLPVEKQVEFMKVCNG